MQKCIKSGTAGVSSAFLSVFCGVFCKKRRLSFAVSVFLAIFAVDLSKVLIKGCRQVAAEMIPSKPDPGNAGVGMDRSQNSNVLVFPFTLFIIKGIQEQ